nr:MAG TPA: hypothetical protein [Caudoviricetes sp.]
MWKLLLSLDLYIECISYPFETGVGIPEVEWLMIRVI